MYSTHNEEKSLIGEKFVGTLKSNVYRYMTSISKMCILISEMIVNKYNNTYSTSKVNLVDVKSSTYINLVVLLMLVVLLEYQNIKTFLQKAFQISLKRFL